MQQKYGVDCLIVGDFCEAFSKLLCQVNPPRPQLWSAHDFAQNFDSLLLPLYQPKNRDQLVGLLQSDLRSQAVQQLNSDLESRYGRVKQVTEDPLILGDYFIRWQRADCVPTFQMFQDLRAAGSERNLMYDREMLALLQRLPAGLRNESNFGAELLGYLHPRAARVPNANTMLPLTAPRLFQKAVKSIKPILGRVRRAFIQQKHVTTGSWPDLPRLYLQDKQWREMIMPLLSPPFAFPEESFDLKQVALSRDRFFNGDLAAFTAVNRMLGLSMIFKAFIH
jgi:hypothetical protein